MYRSCLNKDNWDLNFLEPDVNATKREEFKVAISLKKLFVACYLYSKMNNYDESYLKIKDIYKKKYLEETDFSNLIIWLRSWGCRQFHKANDDDSILGLKNWYDKRQGEFPGKNTSLMKNESPHSKTLFESLAEVEIPKVKVGPVGASKILFALRPHLFVPWDNEICKKLRFKKMNSEDYVEYLSFIKEMLQKIVAQCKTKGIETSSIPKSLCRPNSTLPKLIDEYLWITCSKGIDVDELLMRCQARSVFFRSTLVQQ